MAGSPACSSQVFSSALWVGAEAGVTLKPIVERVPPIGRRGFKGGAAEGGNGGQGLFRTVGP